MSGKLYTIEFSSRADKEMKSLEINMKEKVTEVLDFLAVNPRIGKPLSGEFKGYWSARAWPLRIIYEIKDRYLIVYIIRIAHRKDVYRKM